MFGETKCISYQIEGSDKRKCGSLHKIGLPLFVLLPLTAQLLEPVISSGLGIMVEFVSNFGFKDTSFGSVSDFGLVVSYLVPIGIIGSSSATKSGYSFRNASFPYFATKFEFSISYSKTESIFAIFFRSKPTL